MRPDLLPETRIFLPVLVCCGLIWGTVQVAVAAPDASADVFNRRRDLIARLSASQRQELIRKYDAFRQMTEAERHQLRQLHQQVEADPDLKNIMQEFGKWMKNLDVTQREQLRQARTPEQKRELVVRLRAEQAREKSEIFRVEPAPRERLPFTPLPGDGLQTVMQVLEQELIQSAILTKDQQPKLESLKGTQRYRLLMQTIGEYRHPKDAPVRRFTLSDPVLKAIADVIPNPDLKRLIRAKIGATEYGPYAQDPIYRILLFSTINEARRELNGPDAEALKESLFQSLKPELQSHYSQLPLVRQEFALTAHYLDELRQAFAAASDSPLGLGERGQQGRGFKGFPGPGAGNRNRDGQNGIRPPRNPQEVFENGPDGRRPNREGRDKPGE